MIAQMKKLILFMPDSAIDVDAELTALGELGVIHIMPLQKPERFTGHATS